MEGAKRREEANTFKQTCFSMSSKYLLIFPGRFLRGSHRLLNDSVLSEHNLEAMG
jgi:hypothetical protein